MILHSALQVQQLSEKPQLPICVLEGRMINSDLAADCTAAAVGGGLA